ncbi:hypothetical protein AHAS_Ahas17G0164600 [Arachis hypogaea]
METNITSKVPVKWKPLPQGWLKLNIDAALSDGTKIGTVAAVIRDHNGNVLGGTVTKITAQSILLAEAQAVREAIILADNLGIQKATIESDSQLLVQILKTGCTIWEVDPIIQDIRKIKRRIFISGFTWTPRGENKLAYILSTIKTLELATQFMDS